MLHLKRYFFLYTISTLLVVATAACYYQFVILQDYTVTYEIDCDPRTTTCFVGCEDSTCDLEYHYSLITRKATTIQQLCGPDITGCEVASTCQLAESECSITHCEQHESFVTCTDAALISTRL